MKYWWKNVVKDYFTFTAKERNGLIILFFIAVIIFSFSKYFPMKKVPVSKDAFRQELAQLKITVDSSQSNRSYTRKENYVDYSEPKVDLYAKGSERELFDFDPNTLDAAGWKRLGVPQRTISTIQKFLASGYKFRQPEDIEKIFGLSKEVAKQFIPHIHIANRKSDIRLLDSNNETTTSTTKTIREAKRIQVIDINTSDTSEFISLPGIGSKLATRIINFRLKLGGFSSVAQLGETYGIPDSTFQKIKPYLQCAKPALKTININSADINVLRSHPYLHWNIANAIINYRLQHGNYKSIEDLKRIDIITEDLYNKIAPYLVV